MGKETKIIILLVIDSVFCLLEAVTGYAVHSLALVADAFHMLNDVFSLIVALWAVRVAKNRDADSKYTYGWQRAEILGALINAVFLLALCLSIFIEAIQRLISPEVITNPKLILVVGCAGLASNFIGLLLFHEHGHGHSHGGIEDEPAVGEPTEIAPLLPDVYVAHHEHEHSHLSKSEEAKSLNMKGVFLHVMGDALGNVGVIITALLIWKTNYTWKYYFDPIVSLFITAIIFSTALPLCKTSSKILLQATPSTVDADHVQESILALPGVISVHDFHIWNLTEKISIASLHAEINVKPEDFNQVVTSIRNCVFAHGIQSVTVQPEFTGSSTSSSSQKSAENTYISKNCSQLGLIGP